MNRPSAGAEQLLTPAEVAGLFRVDPKTVTRWAKAGKLDCVRTLGGHRRYPANQVYALLAEVNHQPSTTPTNAVPPPRGNAPAQNRTYVLPSATLALPPSGKQARPRTLNLSKRNVQSR